MENSILEMYEYSFVMKLMYKFLEKTVAKGFHGKIDYSNPAFKLMVASGADSPMRATVLSSGGKMSTKIAQGLVDMANGHYLCGLKKIINLNRWK